MAYQQAATNSDSSSSSIAEHVRN